MRDDPTTESIQELSGYLKGNAHAVKWVSDLFAVLHFFDDLVDRDHPMDDARTIARLWQAVVDLPTNPFFLAHHQALAPAMALAITNWDVATRFERFGDEADKRVAFVLRSSYADILELACLIVGGREWAAEQALDIRRKFHAEGLDGYLANLDKEAEARNGML